MRDESTRSLESDKAVTIYDWPGGTAWRDPRVEAVIFDGETIKAFGRGGERLAVNIAKGPPPGIDRT